MVELTVLISFVLVRLDRFKIGNSSDFCVGNAADEHLLPGFIRMLRLWFDRLLIQKPPHRFVHDCQHHSTNHLDCL